MSAARRNATPTKSFAISQAPRDLDYCRSLPIALHLRMKIKTGKKRASFLALQPSFEYRFIAHERIYEHWTEGK